uniref:feline leukemia virus subgroup C receptor-related protein 2-like n=1 Tax=Styela clava TaxID=7725 RepID=UPI0019397425|nr:feline leukemia virus subgroup C receptor-related protein 2-like [Styela clava]
MISEDSQMHYETYKIRWIFLCIYCSCLFINQLQLHSFSSNTEIFAEIFDLDLDFANALVFGPFFISSVCLLVVSSLNGVIGVRVLSITMSFSSAVIFVIAAFGFIKRILYPVVLFGHLLCGIALGVNFVFPTVFAASWFSSNEAATVIGTSWSMKSLGKAAAAAFHPLIEQLSNVTEDSSKLQQTQSIFCITGSVLALLLLTFSLCFFVFMKDNPPSPPSAAQAIVIALRNSKVREKEGYTLSITNILMLFKNFDFLLLAGANTLNGCVMILVETLASSMILNTFPNKNDTDVVLITALSSIFSMIAALLTGLFLDKYKQFKGMTQKASLLATLSAGGIGLGHLFRSYTTLTIFYPVASAFHMGSCVSLVEILTEITYPCNKIALISTYYFVSEIVTFGFSFAIRRTMKTHGPNVAILWAIFSGIVQYCLIGCVKPNYRRLSADENDEIKKNLDDEKKSLK